MSGVEFLVAAHELHPAARRVLLVARGDYGAAHPAVRAMTVRPGHLGQRAALMPVLAARLAAGFLPQRPRPWRRLIQPLTGRRPRRIPRTLPKPRLKLSDPLPGLRQVLLRPRQRSPRLGQLPAQRRHQRGRHLISGTTIITGHIWTLLPARSSIRRSLITVVPAQHRQMAPRPNLAPVKAAAHMPPGGQGLWLRMAAGKQPRYA
jgi:hypothetical protein